MASLFNTKISNTYVGLLKLSDNLVLSSTLREISDGSGNGAGVFLNTNGDLKASGILEFGSLKDTGESITISKFVDEADGIANNDNDTSIPTSAAIVDYVAARITLEDLDFSGDSGTGSVDLDSQVFAIVGTANEIETSAGSQQLQIGLPSNVTISNNLQVNGLLKGNNNIVIKDTSDRTMAAFYGGNKSELYFNNSKKLETTSDGTTITGGLTATASSSFTSASFSGTITGVANLSDGSTAVTQSINDGSTKIATTAYVDASVDTVDTLSEILAVGNTTGGTNIAVSANDDITFTDTSKAIFGDANDLQIYHTANSFIYNTTGDLILEQTVNDQDIVFKSDDGSGGTAEYFKLSGSIVKTVFSKNTIHEDNVIGEYGSDGDLQVYHNGSNAFIENNTGALNISQKLDDGIIKFNSDDGSGGTTRYIQIDGSVEKTFFFKNSRHEDNVKAEFGSSGDLEIYHDGSNSHIDDTGTGNLVLRGNGAVSIQKYTGENLGMFNADGSVDLFHDDSKKFETTSTGVTITGVAVADGLQIGDDETIQLGDSQEFSLTHTASGNSIISETGSGNLFIDATNFRVRNSTAGGEDMISADSDGSVTLYNNNAAKLTTSSSGVSITGDLTTSGDAIINGSDIVLNNTGDSATSTITMGGNDMGNKVNSILFAENRSSGAMTFGFTLTNEGASSNNFIIKNHNNSSTGSSALTIARDNGAITTGGNMTVSGDLTVNGTTTTVNTQTLAVEDPLISLAKDNSANSVDIGFYGRYNDGSDKYLGLFADASDSSTFKLFKGTGTEPTTTVDTTASGFAYADLDIGTTLGLTTHGGGWFMEDTTFMKTVNNKSLFGTGNVHMTSFVSVVDSTYFLTPAESTTSLNVAGNISLAVAGKKLISDFSSGGTTRKTELTLYNSSDGAFILNNEHSSTGGIQFQIDGSDAFTIAKSGNISTFSGNVNVDADLKVRGASGEDHFVIAPQAAGSGTILISYNGAETGYEPLVIDAENFTFRHSGTPIISTSGTTTTLAGNLSSTASTVHFSLANMSAYQLNGTYVMDSSRNLVNIGNFRGAGSIKSTLAIDNSTLPDVPSEHVILLNPPITTDYYGGGISWSEGTNTAASLGVYDNGSGGALGMYFATGSNSGISEALRLDKNQNSTFYGDVTIPVDKKLYFGGGNHTYIGEDIDDRLRFFTGGSEFLRFTEDTTNAINLFHDTSIGQLSSGATSTLVVNHEGGTTPTAKFRSRTNRSIVEISDNDTTGYLSAEGSLFSVGRAAGLSDNNINIESGGQVGFGTQAPNHRVDIYAEANVGLRLHRPNSALDSTEPIGIGFSTRSDGTTSTTDTRSGLFSYYNGNLFLSANSSDITSDPYAQRKLEITAAGNVVLSANLMPNAENSHNIGSSSIRWEDLYVDDGYIRDLYIDDYIYHNGDTNTYIRFETDTIKFRTNADDRLIINSTGEVRIKKSIHLGDDSGVLTPDQYSMLIEAPSGTSTNLNMYTLGASVFNISSDGTTGKIGWGSTQEREVNLVNTGTGNIKVGINNGAPTSVLSVKTLQDSSFDEGIGVIRSNSSQTGYINMVGGAMNINAPSSIPIKFRDGGTSNLEINANGHTVVNNDLNVEGGIYGKSYTQTSAGSVTSIIDTNIPVEAGVWELFYMGNPNVGGFGAYKAITTGLIIVTVDFTHPNVVNEIRFVQTSITGGGSSNITLPVAVKILQGGSEYDELNYNTSGQTIRLKITGWAGTVGSNGQARITRRL